MLDVALLGTGGMMPLPHRFLTSLICRLNGKYLLIDCGEGTQVSLKMLGWGFKHIDAICFTHFHADHISGLPGMLLTIGNAGRTEPLHLYGPIGLKEVVKGLCIIAPELPFEIVCNEFDKKGIYGLAVGEYIINALPMDHRITCFGYSLEVLRAGKFDLERAKRLCIPKPLWSELQKNNSVEYGGKRYTSDMVLGEERKGIKISYCTDTRPVLGFSEFVEGSDLFVCEGLYGDSEKLQKVIDHKHMIFSEAATVAKDGHVKELWLTHFSPALVDPKEFLHCATEIFPNSYVGYDRMSKCICFEE